MRPNPEPPVCLLATLTLCTFLVPTQAWAGSAQFRDQLGLLSSADRSAIQAEVTRYPFDVRIITTNDYATASQLDIYVRSQIGSPNAVVVGLDTAHGRTSVHCGVATRIDPNTCKHAADAGNAYFKTSHFPEGLLAIVKSVSPKTVLSPPDSELPPTTAPKRLGTRFILAVLVAIAVALAAAVAIVQAFRRKHSNAA